MRGHGIPEHLGHWPKISQFWGVQNGFFNRSCLTASFTTFGTTLDNNKEFIIGVNLSHRPALAALINQDGQKSSVRVVGLPHP